MRRAPEVVTSNYRSWESRGADPLFFLGLLSKQPWKSDILATRLGCRREEAEAILWSHGFAYDERSEQWILQGDAPAQLLRAT